MIKKNGRLIPSGVTISINNGIKINKLENVTAEELKCYDVNTSVLAIPIII